MLAKLELIFCKKCETHILYDSYNLPFTIFTVPSRRTESAGSMDLCRTIKAHTPNQTNAIGDGHQCTAQNRHC